MEALADTVTITLPDGSTRTVPRGTTVREVAAGDRSAPRQGRAGRASSTARSSTSSTPARARRDASRSSRRSRPTRVAIYRHSTAHLTANAVKRLFPTSRSGSARAIENGYYYDFNPERPFTPEDLAAIEAEMRKIIAEDNPIERLGDVRRTRPSRIFEGQNDPLKVEIIRGIPDDQRLLLPPEGLHRPLPRPARRPRRASSASSS